MISLAKDVGALLKQRKSALETSELISFVLSESLSCNAQDRSALLLVYRAKSGCVVDPRSVRGSAIGSVALTSNESLKTTFSAEVAIMTSKMPGATRHRMFRSSRAKSSGRIINVIVLVSPGLSATCSNPATVSLEAKQAHNVHACTFARCRLLDAFQYFEYSRLLWLLEKLIRPALIEPARRGRKRAASAQALHVN